MVFPFKGGWLGVSVSATPSKAIAVIWWCCGCGGGVGGGGLLLLPWPHGPLGQPSGNRYGFKLGIAKEHEAPISDGED